MLRILTTITTLLCLVSLSVSVRITVEGGAKSVDKEIMKNEAANLFCGIAVSTTGSATDIHISWTYNDVESIVYDGILADKFVDTFGFNEPATLIIKNPQVNDRGKYTCQGTLPSDTPSTSEASYNITVAEPPSVPICSYTSDLALTLEFSAEFHCNSIEGVPFPMYTWFKDGNALPVNSQSTPTYQNTSFTYSRSTGTLYFSKATKADAGVYYCQASNTILGQQYSEQCQPTKITTKDQDIGLIVGIVFGVIFGLLLIGVLIWWTWKKGYCDAMTGGEDTEEMDDEANDIMLDGNGPSVNKSLPPSERGGKQEASMMI